VLISLCSSTETTNTYIGQHRNRDRFGIDVSNDRADADDKERKTHVETLCPVTVRAQREAVWTEGLKAKSGD
jgi:hypothetical protein